jgi:phage shock protein PspC (stress-responsive transcriptional regulator)
MKKTISINLAGLVFNIEEQGYERLKQYLDAIRRIFANEAGASEIMEDIESRIAELFHDRLGKLKQVITEEDISEVIKIMGEPNDYAADGDQIPEVEYNSFENSKNVTDDFRQKRLYRDEDNASVAGVCAGLGHYFNIDPVVFRLIFVLMVILGGSGILIYIILILVVPEAKTTAEKLQMRGEPVNIESIKEHVSNLTEEAKKGVNKASQNVRNVLNKSHGLFQKIFLIASKVIGVGFLIGGLIGIVVFVGIFFGDVKLFPFYAENASNNLYSFLALIFESSHFSWVFIALFFVVIIPLLSLFLLGLKLLVDWKYKMKGFLIGLLVFWVVSIIVLSFYGVETGLQFKEERQVSQLVEYNSEDVGDTLFVDMSGAHADLTHTGDYDASNYLHIDNDSIYLSAITISIIKDASLEDFEVSYQKISNGPTGKIAYENAQAISMNCFIRKNELIYPAYYSFPLEDKIRGQYVRLEIRVPENKYVIIKNYDHDFPGDIQTKSMRRIEIESRDRVWTTTQKEDEIDQSSASKDSVQVAE